MFPGGGGFGEVLPVPVLCEDPGKLAGSFGCASEMDGEGCAAFGVGSAMVVAVYTLRGWGVVLRVELDARAYMSREDMRRCRRGSFREIMREREEICRTSAGVVDRVSHVFRFGRRGHLPHGVPPVLE